MDKLNNLFTAVFIVPLGIFGIMHFIWPQPFEFMVPDFASFIFDSKVWVIISGVILSSTAGGIALNVYREACTYALLVFVLIFIITVDIPSIFKYEEERRFYFEVSLLKDLSLLGGTLILLYIRKLSAQKKPL